MLSLLHNVFCIVQKQLVITIVTIGLLPVNNRLFNKGNDILKMLALQIERISCKIFMIVSAFLSGKLKIKIAGGKQNAITDYPR